MLGNLVKIRQYLWNRLTFQALGELVILKTLKVNKVAKIIGTFSNLSLPHFFGKIYKIIQIDDQQDINMKQKE